MNTQSQPRREQIIHLLRHCAATELAKEELALALERAVAERNDLAEAVTKLATQASQKDAAYMTNQASEIGVGATTITEQSPDLLASRLLQESKSSMPEFLKNSRNDFLLSPNSSINSDSIEEKSFSPSKASALFADNTHQTSTNCDIIGVVDSWSPNYLGKTRSIKQEKHENPIPSLQPLMFDALIQTEEWMIGQTRKNSAFAISNEDNNIRVHTDRLVAVSQNLSTIAKSLHDLNSKLVTKCEFPLQRERNISLEQEKISSDAKTSKPHNQPTIFRDNSTNEEEQALLFSDLDPTTIDTIERLLPTDNSLLFANDTSMVKPLRDVVRDVERLRMTNPMDDGWQAVEMEVSERRTELRASLERREIVDEIKRQNSMSSSFESTKSLKSSLKGSSGNSYHKKSPKMTADMDILIARMNMASSPAH